MTIFGALTSKKPIRRKAWGGDFIPVEHYETGCIEFNAQDILSDDWEVQELEEVEVVEILDSNHRYINGTIARVFPQNADELLNLKDLCVTVVVTGKRVKS